jgi:hypothetical protein
MRHLGFHSGSASAAVLRNALHHIRPSSGPWLVSAGMVVMGIGIYLAAAEWNMRRSRRSRHATAKGRPW